MTEPTAASTQDITEVIAELEQYRDRLVADSSETAKKAQMTECAMMAQLQPELEKIDTTLAHLRTQLQS